MADHRHKRVTNARRKIPKAVFVSAPLAAVATMVTVSAGMLLASPVSGPPLAGAGNSLTAATQSSSAAPTMPPERAAEISRDLSRPAALPSRDPIAEELKAQRREEAATAKAIRNADTRLWATTDLNLWDAPDPKAENLGEVSAGDKVLVTGRRSDGRSEIVVNGRARWVTSGYFAEEKPVVGIGGACTNGTSVESGVSPNIVKVHQAVCSAFPEISIYGTFRGDGEHAQGLAVDIMVSGDRGWEVADFVRENYAALGVSYLIYSQNIWSVERSGEGWRGMSDRGSTTANHYDHVHVTTY